MSGYVSPYLSSLEFIKLLQCIINAFHQIWGVFQPLVLQIFFMFFSLFPSGTPIMLMLVYLIVSHFSLKLCSFFFILLSLCSSVLNLSSGFSFEFLYFPEFPFGSCLKCLFIDIIYLTRCYHHIFLYFFTHGFLWSLNIFIMAAVKSLPPMSDILTLSKTALLPAFFLAYWSHFPVSFHVS